MPGFVLSAEKAKKDLQKVIGLILEKNGFDAEMDCE